jgi:long-subunit acyl-CoA synthetase (AMP-forming)
MAKMLYDAGIRQNDVISIISENRNEYVAVSFATLFLNAILAPINSTYTDREC